MVRPKHKKSLSKTTKATGTKPTTKKQTKVIDIKSKQKSTKDKSAKDKIYLGSDFIQVYLLKGDSDSELIFKRICGKIPTGICSKMNQKEIEQIKLALDFCEHFRDVKMVKSVEFLEGYFGSVLVGPFETESAALNAVEIIEVDLTHIEPKKDTIEPPTVVKDIEHVLLKDYNDLDEEPIEKDIVSDEEDIPPELDEIES